MAKYIYVYPRYISEAVMTDRGDGLNMGGWEHEEERKTHDFPLEQVGWQGYDLRWGREA